MSGGLDDIRASELAGGERAEVAPELLRELLSFQLAGSPYAVPVERVREIVRLRQITPVPRVPAAVLGVIGLRGEIVQVVDLRMRLELPLGELTRQSRIVVLHAADDRVSGVFVDRVDEVLRAPEESIQAATGGAGFVSDICVRGSEFVSIIDVDRALDLDGN